MKILIAVLSLNDNGGTYSKFYKAQKETWDSVKVDGVDTYYYFGNGKTNQIIGNDIITDVSESLYNCGHKTIKALELLKNLDFDFLFRTNSSSYVDKHLLKEFLKTKPKKLFYSGILGSFEQVHFASGSGFFLSKDLVIKVLSNKNNWNHGLIDDVALSRVLKMFNITPTNSIRYDVEDGIEIPKKFFHYRLRTNDRNIDIDNMYKIFKLKTK